MSKVERVYLEDGDTLAVIAKTPLSASDPTDERPYVSAAYRVVADRFDPMLALVPLVEIPVPLSEEEVSRGKYRDDEVKFQELLRRLGGDAVKVFKFIVEATGWKFDADVIRPITSVTSAIAQPDPDASRVVHNDLGNREPVTTVDIMNARRKNGAFLRTLQCQYYRCPVLLNHQVGAPGCAHSGAADARL